MHWKPFLKGEEYVCDRCSIREKRSVKKPLEAFTASMKKRIIGSPWKTSLLCRECQCPPCLNCGKRAEDADSKAVQIQDNYFCEDCRKDHKRKQCKECEEWKSLSCYPESVRKAIAKPTQGIQNKHHLCTECIEKKKVTLQTPKECSKCHKKKKLECYPASTQASAIQCNKIRDDYHWCSDCLKRYG